MKIKHLTEALAIYSDGKFKYANIDAKAVYDNCINAEKGGHTFEEAKQFKDFVGITPETTEEELRAIRNTLVRYWSDYIIEFRKKDTRAEHTKEEWEQYDKMADQMQFYTTVIDMTIDKLTESLNEIKIDTIRAANDKSQDRIMGITNQMNDLQNELAKKIANLQKKYDKKNDNLQKKLDKEVERKNRLSKALAKRKNDGYSIEVYDDFDDGPLMPFWKDFKTEKEALDLFNSLNTEKEWIDYVNANTNADNPCFPIENVMGVAYYDINYGKVVKREVKFFNDWFKNRWEKEVTPELN